ncbi:DUF2271 domain-containing protein [Sphingobium sp. JS3065]|uniref:DUF2271 domain-containing protein n=1 Tax=Sphingobium sp. JS3065 TaxID=2970925 RepID=UPI002263BAF7|nr:DUF2271 domain-containing protein [Sphingobium sp. JS3065]UZW57309.1 DUF2271 domain-containing protein [Sphingobium sp. JS3065]
MQISHKIVLTGGILSAATALATPATAQTLDVTVTLPRLSVAEYHRPYVAIWLEKEGAPARTLAVWYDVDKAKGEGTKWLRDIRQWWRVSGRSMRFPADGVSGATRAPGPQKASLPVGKLTPGNYTLVVEAAREVGGREIVKLPFAWPLRANAGVSAKGSSELGTVSFTVGK